MVKYHSYCRGIILGLMIVVLGNVKTLWADEYESYYNDSFLVDSVLSSKYLSGGTASLNLNSLNNEIEKLGLARFAPKPYMLEIGQVFLIEQLIIEYALGGMLWKSTKHYTSEATLMGGYTHFTLGINFLPPQESWQLYPFFSIGGAFFRLKYEEESVNVPKDQVIQPGVYWQPSVITRTGIALNFKSLNSETGKVLSLGVRAGAFMDPTPQYIWYKNSVKHNLKASPLFAGPFFQVVLTSGIYIK
jgi:hypothetical protein